jgi:hypothetical protein
LPNGTTPAAGRPTTSPSSASSSTADPTSPTAPKLDPTAAPTPDQEPPLFSRQGDRTNAEVLASGNRSQTAAALIDHHLTAPFGSDQVFLDGRSIPAGTDFVDVLLGRVGTCSVLLSLVCAFQWVRAHGRTPVR